MATNFRIAPGVIHESLQYLIISFLESYLRDTLQCTPRIAQMFYNDKHWGGIEDDHIPFKERGERNHQFIYNKGKNISLNENMWNKA